MPTSIPLATDELAAPDSPTLPYNDPLSPLYQFAVIHQQGRAGVRVWAAGVAASATVRASEAVSSDDERLTSIHTSSEVMPSLNLPPAFADRWKLYPPTPAELASVAAGFHPTQSTSTLSESSEDTSEGVSSISAAAEDGEGEAWLVEVFHSGETPSNSGSDGGGETESSDESQEESDDEGWGSSKEGSSQAATPPTASPPPKIPMAKITRRGRVFTKPRRRVRVFLRRDRSCVCHRRIASEARMTRKLQVSRYPETREIAAWVPPSSPAESATPPPSFPSPSTPPLAAQIGAKRRGELTPASSVKRARKSSDGTVSPSAAADPPRTPTRRAHAKITYSTPNRPTGNQARIETEVSGVLKDAGAGVKKTE